MEKMIMKNAGGMETDAGSMHSKRIWRISYSKIIASFVL